MLVYGTLCSLDGYTEDATGKFDWAAPGEDVHAFVNDLERGVATHLYGRRMYETMVAWETMDDPAPVMRDYAQIWRAAEKVVYSRTLESAASERTRIEREFDPRALPAGRASIGGAELAGQAISAGVVDEIHLFVVPVIVGGGKAALPTGVRMNLRLVDQRGFADGTVHLHYAR